MAYVLLSAFFEWLVVLTILIFWPIHMVAFVVLTLDNDLEFLG